MGRGEGQQPGATPPTSSYFFSSSTPVKTLHSYFNSSRSNGNKLLDLELASRKLVVATVILVASLTSLPAQVVELGVKPVSEEDVAALLPEGATGALAGVLVEARELAVPEGLELGVLHPEGLEAGVSARRASEKP